MDWSQARATATITIVTLVASLLILAMNLLPEAAVGGGFIPLRFDAAVPPDAGFPVPAILTPLTATLIHGGFAHVALNLLMLVYCGGQAERAVGARGIVLLYVAGAFAAALGQYLMDPVSHVPMIGASGAISAVVGAYALLYGQRRAQAVAGVSADVVHVLWLAAAWIGIQLLVGLAGFGGTTIAIGAHIGGFIAGLALARPLLLWRYRGA
ncbi:rhomboid family intramembrane serine protease [Sphingomonas carotinifaciens]|uniref:Membrane associated serine protease, rhomboid family n=2 Tax=Sphingomonas carotinifaciens TaxID=1166323 RepID=A0A1G7IJA7_9SPHN|nr:rhomboid family intramembrane serine protease [Sphingomonas carotinifaciens]MBB4084846.1 membrane associated rhomboid family serine protease [Sphingomonas carotinifaciens]SDF12797.1 Membrane associated serine protease, rhomboid family [Sphingomonas carotinifaciens]